MPGSLQSKGDGEYSYSAPFTGLNGSVASILLPPSAQEIQTSPSFSIVRGSIAAPWPFGTSVFNWAPGSGEYFLFATPGGYIASNLKFYQIQSSNTTGIAWVVNEVSAMPAGAFPAQGTNKEFQFVEANGCVFFASQIGILRYASSTGAITQWSVGFMPLYMTIFMQRMVVVGTVASTDNVTPGTPTGTPDTAGGSVPAGTYFAVVTAVFASGIEGPPSPESAGVTLSGTGEITWTWTAVTGAVTYNIYVGNAAGSEDQVFSSTPNTYLQTTFNTEPTETISPPVAPPNSPWTIAWSTVTDFSDTSVGSFNSNPNTNAGDTGGFDVLTNYSQGLAVGIVNLGNALYVIMTQGIVQVDPASSGTAPFTFYNFWQERIPVGALLGTLDQFGPIAAFVSPDNVNVWVPGSQSQIGTPIMAYLRSLFRNMTMQEDPNAAYPLLLNPPSSASFYTLYNENHYALSFNVFGVPPQQLAPPYPNQIAAAEWFGLIVDYNFSSQAWSQQVTPPITGRLYQVSGPPLTQADYTQIPPQTFLVAGSQPNGPGTQAGVLVFAPDVFNRLVFATQQCLGLSSNPQPCMVGFPQTPVAGGHTPAIRRVRVEYSMDEFSCGSQAAPATLTISMQGVNCTNNAGPNTTANFISSLQSVSTQVILNPIGAIGVNSANPVVPFLTAVAYADFTLSIQNPQISLSWTDPSAHQRYLIHRVTPMLDDTQGSLA
jgi:hypothetical protein